MQREQSQQPSPDAGPEDPPYQDASDADLDADTVANVGPDASAVAGEKQESAKALNIVMDHWTLTPAVEHAWFTLKLRESPANIVLITFVGPAGDSTLKDAIGHAMPIPAVAGKWNVAFGCENNTAAMLRGGEVTQLGELKAVKDVNKAGDINCEMQIFKI